MRNAKQGGRDQSHKAQKNVRILGIIQITCKGTGYLPWEGHEDIEIERENLQGALNSDEVEVAVRGMRLPRGKSALRNTLRPHGEVVRVV